MNKRRVEKMIPSAMKQLNQDLPWMMTENSSRFIPSRYNGYIASFGPCVVQAGLIQTLAFFSRADRDERADEEGKERKRIIELMDRTLKDAEMLKGKEAQSLLDIAMDCETATERIRIKSLILEASVACKLAMRTFPVKKDQGGE